MRFLVTAGLLLATAGYVALHPPVNLAVGRGVLAAVPSRFGPWNGTELSFEDAVVEELKADDVLIRRYESAGQVVWLCLVYHQNRRYGAHDPRLCYESQGYVVESEGRARVADGAGGGIEVNSFIASRRSEQRVVWYWWTTKGLSTADAEAFRRRMAVAGALENRSWGSFVRVESIARDGDIAAATRRVADFSARVAASLPGVFAATAETRAAAR